MAPHKLANFIEPDSDGCPDMVDIDENDSEISWSLPLDEKRIRTAGMKHEPIAIVGIGTLPSHYLPSPGSILTSNEGCRLPGDVKSASNLWDLLEKRSGHSEIPPSRWNINAFYHPNGANKIGCMSMRSGYFIHEDLREFENSFIGINNIEATFMDPQQRKLLEVVYECLESAGIHLIRLTPRILISVSVVSLSTTGRCKLGSQITFIDIMRLAWVPQLWPIALAMRSTFMDPAKALVLCQG